METATIYRIDQRELVTHPADSGRSFGAILSDRKRVDLRDREGNVTSYRCVSSQMPDEYVTDDCEPFADAIEESMEFIPRPFVDSDNRLTSFDYALASDQVTLEVSRCNHIPVDLWGALTEDGCIVQWEASLLSYEREKIRQDCASVALATYSVEIVG